MTEFKQQIVARAQKLARRIVLPEGDDPRVIQAAYQIASQGIAKPVILCDIGAFEAERRSLGLAEPDFEVIDPKDHQEEIGEIVFQVRQHKGITLDEAYDRAVDRMVQAAIMLRVGKVDGVVAGAVHTTAETVRTAIQFIGLAPNIAWVSSFFAMVLGSGRGQRALMFADCGVLPEPDEDQFVSIANASIRSWRQLVETQPRLAFLAFSTRGSAEHESLVPIRAAMQRVRAEHPSLMIDGELQVDAALVPHVARRKAPGSAVDGQADILIFPNLHAGNIAYKITERLAGAVALGPILQGLAKPMNDLSRGCHVEDIVLVSAITAIQSTSQGV